MNVTDKMLDGRWVESGFEITPQLTVPSRGPVESQLEELKGRLLKPVLDRVAGANQVLAQELKWAANEATALAWYTFCPILVLPSLLEEKVSTTIKRWQKQQAMLRA